MTPEITRRFEIDAGHRLLGHESKCRHVHGHRYVFEVTVAGKHLDDVGRVIDFGCVKEHIGNWLDTHWDHAFLVEGKDPFRRWLRENEMRHDVLPYPPSAEHLSQHLHGVAERLLAHLDIRVVRVRCYETPNCWSDYPPSRA